MTCINGVFYHPHEGRGPRAGAGHVEKVEENLSTPKPLSSLAKNGSVRQSGYSALHAAPFCNKPPNMAADCRKLFPGLIPTDSIAS